MRVLFTSWAWPTHYYQMVPLAWALRAAGHEVRAASSPSLSATIAASGVPAVAVGDDSVDAVARIRDYIPGRAPTGTPGDRPTRAKGPRAVGLFADLATAMADDLVAYCRAWRPDVIVYEPTAYAGPLAAAVLGVPAVRFPWGADLMHRAGAVELEREVMAPLCERFGLDGVDLLGSLTVDPCPAAMQVPAAEASRPIVRQPVRPVPYNGSGSLPVPLPPAERRRPRVCVTWGTTVGRLHDDMYLAPRIVAALDSLDVGIVVAVAREQRHLLGAVPERVKVLESVPLHAVLPYCDAVVAHGGAGTILTSLAAGLPQLVVPQLIDHTFNAQRFTATGAGLSLTKSEAEEPERIRTAVLELLEQPAYRKAAQEVRDEIELRPAPARIVDVLTGLAAAGPATPPSTPPAEGGH
ncbi:nucleotide disphospho-sugar-binding domain-containing protein [Streptomyces sp. NPDC020681]|uniref:nucleotide disphospho-sugar-binding domain-containing protein n=1 Tax=Streptomyces sp. NPDC020681 TaxID=3365083 RepID=UPI00379437C4